MPNLNTEVDKHVRKLVGSANVTVNVDGDATIGGALSHSQLIELIHGCWVQSHEVRLVAGALKVLRV